MGEKYKQEDLIMANVVVNAVGDQCPIPVVKATKALKAMTEAGIVEVHVDNEIAVQNLTRLAELGWQVTIREDTEIPAGQILPELE